MNRTRKHKYAILARCHPAKKYGVKSYHRSEAVAERKAGELRRIYGGSCDYRVVETSSLTGDRDY